MKHSGWVPVAVSPSSSITGVAVMNKPLGAAATSTGKPVQRIGFAERAVGAVRGEDRDQAVDVFLGDGHRVAGQQLLDLDEVVSSRWT